MNGNGGKEKCIHDGKEMLQHVGKTVYNLVIQTSILSMRKKSKENSH